MIDQSMSRMRFDETANNQEEFPARATLTGRWLLSPNDPDFVPREPWRLDGLTYDEYGDPVEND